VASPTTHAWDYTVKGGIRAYPSTVLGPPVIGSSLNI